MEELSFRQRQIIANFCTNVAVGWFITGVITPFLSAPSNILEIYVRFGRGAVMTYLFLMAGVSLVKE